MLPKFFDAYRVLLVLGLSFLAEGKRGFQGLGAAQSGALLNIQY
jgi:hypothetical protein